MARAGWYPNPASGASGVRWWDGEAWTSDVRTLPNRPEAQPSPTTVARGRHFAPRTRPVGRHAVRRDRRARRGIPSVAARKSKSLAICVITVTAVMLFGAVEGNVGSLRADTLAANDVSAVPFGSDGQAAGRPVVVADNVQTTIDRGTAAGRTGSVATWSVRLRPGTYLVTVKSTERSVRGAGERIFSVTANGTTLAKNIDLFAARGFDRPLVLRFRVALRDGRLTLGFPAAVGRPEVDSISVAAAGGAKGLPPPPTMTSGPPTSAPIDTVAGSTGGEVAAGTSTTTTTDTTLAPITIPLIPVLGGGPPTTATPQTTLPPPPQTPPLQADGPGQVFSPSSAWNTPVSATAAPAGVTQGWVNQSLWTVSVYHGGASTPMVAVTAAAGWGWPAATLQLPIPAGARPTNDGDAEMVIVNDSTGDVTDLYAVKVTQGGYSAASYAKSNLFTSTGFGTGSPFLGAGVRAIGCSALGGLLLGSDLSSGLINHALALALPYSLLNGSIVAPAIAGDAGGGPGVLREGARLAIPAGTPKPTTLSAVGSVVWDALVRYGALIVDQNTGTAATFYMDNVSTTAAQASQFQADANALVSALHQAS